MDPEDYGGAHSDEYAEAIHAEPEERDYHLEKNVFWVPALARWKTIQDNAKLEGDPRWRYRTPPKGNANFAWVQHMRHHLAPNGLAGKLCFPNDSNAPATKAKVTETPMPRSRYRFLGDDAPYFMTISVSHWLPVFTRPETVQIVLSSWRWLQGKEELRLHGYVILEKHLHLVARSPDIGETNRRFKSYTARRIIDQLQMRNARQLLELLALFKRAHKTQSDHQVWEEGSHPQRIESEEVMRQKLDYIHQNPVKRGFVDLPERWRWSSARNYAGLDGLIEVDRGWRSELALECDSGSRASTRSQAELGSV